MDYGSIDSNPFFPMMVQYLIDFITTNKGKTQEEFISYLQSKNDANLVQYIQQNEQLANYLANMIQDKSDEAKKQLADINSILASIMASTKAFAPVASIMNIQSDLSEQAISILKQFVESGGDTMIPAHTLGRQNFIFDNGALEYSEERFLNDDINALVAFGFIRGQLNSKGNTVYKITRNAVKFIESLPKEEKNG